MTLTLTLKLSIAVAILAEAYRLWKSHRAAALARRSRRS